MAQSLRVLFIGDRGQEEVTGELVRAGYEPSVKCVASAADLESALAQPWDIAISDFVVGDSGALAALRAIRERSLDLPVILVSGNIKDHDAVEALQAGAADYIRRASLTRLRSAVEREIRGVRLRRERNQLEDQFRQVQKMEAVGRLAGGVAHDFNNLLTVITGYSDLLLNGPGLTEPQRSALEQIRRSAERGGALTHQLLAFSRRQPLQTRALHVNALVLQMEKMLGRLIGEDVRLLTIPAAVEDVVEADAGRLEQVIMNLAVNARDAMPEGGRLAIETANVTLDEKFPARQLDLPTGRYLALSVTDTGVGMDEETLSHAFEPFFTTKKAGSGTGLGLATAYGIVRQSGGAIQITSEVGRGTVACIYLPLAQQNTQATHEESAVPTAARGAETVLVVEDETEVRQVMVDVLRGRGYRVLDATRGKEAKRLARRHGRDIDLAVVDVIMPELSGPELIRQITPFCPQMRVLYVSGYNNEAILQLGASGSGAAFLAKPFMPEDLARSVRTLLDRDGICNRAAK